MSKTKLDYIKELVQIAFDIDEKAKKVHEITKEVQIMASLARQGLKDTKEFKSLELKHRQPRVNDFGDDVLRIQRIVKSLKRYSW